MRGGCDNSRPAAFLELVWTNLASVEVGWAEWSESHQLRTKRKMVGLAPLGPPYFSAHPAFVLHAGENETFSYGPSKPEA